MTHVAEYKNAIQWLQRGMAEQAREPGNLVFFDSVLLSFEVTYNVDEGLPLCSSESWLRYGLAFACANETLGNASSEWVPPLLPRFAEKLESFATRHEERLLPIA